MEAVPIKFGTDGWRGRIADNYTFSSVRRCADGFAQYLAEAEGKGRPVVVGYDRRFASESFAATASEVLAGHGFQVLLTREATPTPAISNAVLEHSAVGAVNITASHNPPADNGFKVRNRFGGAIAPENLKRIEDHIPDTAEHLARIRLSEGLDSGAITYIDPGPAYVAKIETLVDLDRIRNAGLSVLIDAMWGNGAAWFPRLLDGASTQVAEIHSERNPVFPEMSRPEPIPPNVDVGLAATVESGADVLVITDGDADRLGVGDERGFFIDQLRVYGLLAYYLLEVRGERGPIVKTLSTTSLLLKLAEMYDVPIYETGVGFKYVAPKMLEVDALIGGEESGGFAFRGHVPERDGILAGLYILDMMVQLERKPSELIELLFDRVGPSYYKRIDTPMGASERAEKEALAESADPDQIGGLKVTGVNRTDGHKFELEDGGWLLVRFSGTEPVVRVYCETTEEQRVDPILADGLKIVGLQ
ncbi:MAG: phosphoglucomutase/phosphomannomutase family protein [Anaerolineales bacterium]